MLSRALGGGAGGGGGIGATYRNYDRIQGFGFRAKALSRTP